MVPQPTQSAADLFTETQRPVTGWVLLQLYKGSVSVLGRHSDNSLYREDLATFGEESVYDQKDARGFINLFGLPIKVKAMIDNNEAENKPFAAPDYSKFKRD